MATYLDRLIAYDTWANQGLLDFLREQPPETLDLTRAASTARSARRSNTSSRARWATAVD